MTPTQSEKCRALFSQYHRLMLYVANEILRDWQLSEDAAQEAFLRVMKNIDKIGAVECHKTRKFLVVIVRNIARSKYKERKAEDPPTDPEEMKRMEIVDPTLSAEAKLQIEEGLQQINPTHREVLLLMLKGYSTNEIAEILAVQEPAARKRIQRAREALLSILKGEDDR